MNYRFENIYTYAEFQKWGIDIRNILAPNQLLSGFIMSAYTVQFFLWLPVFLLIAPLDISIFSKAISLYFAILVVTYIYENFVFPRLASFYDRRRIETLPNKFESVIEVDDMGIVTQDKGRETRFTWEAFHGVVDKETKVIFISDTIHCVIPARCFAGFLEKDAFVRACREKISGRTEQGEVFT